MTNKEQFLFQLQVKIDMYENKMKQDLEGLKSAIGSDRIYFNTLTIENIKTYERVIEELKQQKQAFELLFSDLV